MKLLAKFNLILGLVFGAGLAIAAVVSHGVLQDGARDDVLRQARLMMEAMRSARDYTTRQIKPLLVTQQEHQRSFLPQTVPAFAATENFDYLRASYPDYAYKEAALNPTNPRDRAVDWEADIINSFRNHPAGAKELVGERDTPMGRSLYLARPIQANPPCLECHSLPRVAPAAMIRRYGSNNGFGWQPNEIIGAQIVSVPMALPIRMAAASFRTLLIDLAAIFVASLILLDVVLLSQWSGRCAAFPLLPTRSAWAISICRNSRSAAAMKSPSWRGRSIECAAAWIGPLSFWGNY